MHTKGKVSVKQHDIIESSKGNGKLVAWLKEHVWSTIVSFTLAGSNVATITTSIASRGQARFY